MTVLEIKRRALKYVRESFRRETDLSSWVWRYELLSRLPSQDPVSHPDTWYRYLVTLLETGHLRRVDWALDRYLKKGGELKNFNLYFRLAKLAVEHDCNDTAVRRCAEVGARLGACHKERQLARMVEEKTVALVGNGPQEVGRGSGPEIDAHDIVIRINNYDIVGRAADYGTRTDVWSKNLTPEQRHKLPDSGIRLVIYSEDLMRDMLEYDYVTHIEDDLNDPRIAVDYIDHCEKAFVTDAIHAFPTAGASLIAKLRTCHPKSVDVYGFSLLQPRSQAADYSRLPKDVPTELQKERVAFHGFPQEVEFLRKHFQGRRYHD